MYTHTHIIGPPREQLRQLQQYANTNQPAEEMSSVMGLMGMPVRGVGQSNIIVAISLCVRVCVLAEFVSMWTYTCSWVYFDREHILLF